MDTTRFDRIVMNLGQSTRRRDVLRFLGAATFSAGSLTLFSSAESEAKRKHKKGKKKRNNGQGSGQSCKDGRKNGSETDVDCGGSCPRCDVQKSCASRDDCTTAFCDGGVCKQPASLDDCGVDTDGGMCATRTNTANQKICTKINGRFFGTGTCAERCLPTEQCVLPGAGVECVLPCGAPDA